MNEKQDDKLPLFALWKKEGRGGGRFWSGKLDREIVKMIRDAGLESLAAKFEQTILVFDNNRKKASSNQPDLQGYLMPPRDQPEPRRLSDNAGEEF